MPEWKARRFWRESDVVATPGGFELRLDGRGLRTPAKAPLTLPSRALAEAIRAEWDAQAEKIDPRSMPLTRLANSAVDTVAVQQRAVAEVVAAYGESDLVCYRADAPDALAERQAKGWDPLVDWAATSLGAPLKIGTGVMFIRQSDAALAALASRVHALDPWDLAALHELVALSGSLVIGLAVIEAVQPHEALWRVSRIDEDWQQELWGVDEEAAAAAALKAEAFLDAARFHALRHGD
ncbi:MAG: ATPase [Rhodobacteraceae bacterium]|nr:ATPase [Paracoccaceae bacterium]